MPPAHASAALAQIAANAITTVMRLTGFNHAGQEPRQATLLLAEKSSDAVEHAREVVAGPRRAELGPGALGDSRTAMTPSRTRRVIYAAQTPLAVSTQNFTGNGNFWD